MSAEALGEHIRDQKARQRHTVQTWIPFKNYVSFHLFRHSLSSSFMRTPSVEAELTEITQLDPFHLPGIPPESLSLGLPTTSHARLRCNSPEPVKVTSKLSQKKSSKPWTRRLFQRNSLLGCLNYLNSFVGLNAVHRIWQFWVLSPQRKYLGTLFSYFHCFFTLIQG